MRNSPHAISGAAIIATPWPSRILSWCEECCSNEWIYESTHLRPVVLGDHTLTVFAFYFSSQTDMEMFQKAFLTEMRLALEIQD